MESEIPWSSCLLTRMLILHLERMGKDQAVDYYQILSGFSHVTRIKDPKDFLKDANNWVPHHVLKNLIHAAESATDDKRVAYLAARNYFQINEVPSLIEIIALFLNDIEQILLCSNLWAEGYTNYLKLQCFRPSGSDGTEAVVLSQFGLGVEPVVGNVLLVQGNYEGFTRLFGDVKEVACVEEVSQLTLETVVKEFGDYQIQTTRNRISILDPVSQKEVLAARKIHLQTESIPFCAHNWAGGEGFIVEPENGRITVIAPAVEERSGTELDAHAACEIIREGTLQSNGLSLTLKKGQIFNAPYSRYRFRWKSKKALQDRPELAETKAKIVPLLFEHLRRIRNTQRRLLVCAIKNEELARVNENLQAVLQKDSNFFGILWKSAKMEQLLWQARRVAETDSTVLIVGETGTGKELLAKAIHQLSSRRDKKFFAVNCATLAESLLEAELFGYEKGAFTGAVTQKKGIFEVADGGTLFLDEVGELSPAMQAKLLRVLEEREIQRVGGRTTIPIDVRIISATNQNLEELVAAGTFRRDLFYRLHVISLTIPPLRERLEDLPLLIEHYIDYFSQKYKKARPAVTRAAYDVLVHHAWPGNIRQLKNVIERAVVLDHDRQLTPEDVILPDTEKDTSQEAIATLRSFHDAVKQFKRSVIDEALRQSGGNQTKAANLLGLQRTYLARLIRILNVPTKI